MQSQIGVGSIEIVQIFWLFSLNVYTTISMVRMPWSILVDDVCLYIDKTDLSL